MTNKFVKQIEFKEDNRAKFTFSDATKIRLNPDTNQIELKKDVNGFFSTDADLFVKTQVMNPEALLQWLRFHFEPRTGEQPALTTIQFKLNDGTTDRFFSGGSWVAAGASDWNSEAIVAANIATYPVTSKKLQVIVNLATTDKKVTPVVKLVAVLMDGDFDYLDSIVGDSLVPSLRETIRPVVDFALEAPHGGTRISLRDVEFPYDIDTIERAYDHDGDAGHVTNILSSYDAANNMAILTASVAVGRTIWFRIRLKPRIYVNWASQDFVEVEKLPAVVLSRFVVTGNQVFGRAFVRDVNVPDAVILENPYKVNIDVDILLLAEKNRPLIRLHDQGLKHTINNPMLRWRAVDEEITMYTTTEPDFRQRPDLRDQHGSTYSLRLQDVFMWLKAEQTLPLVQQVNLTTLKTV